MCSTLRFRTDGITEYVSVHHLQDRARLFVFLKENHGFFAGTGNSSVAAFLYSCMLTRQGAG
jgi:hypothetical protein